eukprot:3403731-Karenia_brevis.AAC.1
MMITTTMMMMMMMMMITMMTMMMMMIPQGGDQEAPAPPSNLYNKVWSRQVVTLTEQDWEKGSHGSMSLAEMM